MRRNYRGNALRRTNRNRLAETVEVEVKEGGKSKVLFPTSINVVEIDTEDDDYINFYFKWYDNDKDIIKEYYKTLKEEHINWKKNNPGKSHRGEYNIEKEMFRVLGNLVLDSSSFRDFCSEKGLFYIKLRNLKFTDWGIDMEGGKLVLEKETIKEALISNINTGWGFFK